MESATREAGASAVPSITPPSHKKQHTTKKSSSSAAAPKSVDSQVQHTNDDSIVSKRSAGRMGYIADDYLRHFVRKVARRSPLINRGYYLRILAMTRLVEDTLRHWCAVSSQPQKLQVISLGAGFDTLAARNYDRHEFRNVSWYEVDFPDVIHNKVELMCAAPLTSFPFHKSATVRATEDGKKEILADRYCAIGLDLRQTERHLVSRLASAAAATTTTSCPSGFTVDAPTVVYAECVMQYMTPECSSSIVSWVARTFPNAIFFSYDQLHASDSFGCTMVHSLKSKQSPLLGITNYPDGVALSRRAVDAGMPFVRFADFYRMSRYLFDATELARMDAIETFDECEEWTEMCEHYGILCGATSPQVGHDLTISWPLPSEGNHDSGNLFVDVLPSTSMTAAPSNRDGSVVGVSKWPTGRCALEGWGFGNICTLDPSTTGGDVALIAFGGLLTSKGQARSQQVLIHSLAQGDIPTLLQRIDGDSAAASELPPAIVFHSFHQVAKNVYWVIGGRTNPLHASNDVYEFTLDTAQYPERVICTWRLLSCHLLNQGGTSAPPPRYRHAAVVLTQGDSSSTTQQPTIRVFVYGGRSSSGATLGDAWMVSSIVDSGACTWTAVTLSAPLPPLHSSAMVSLPTRRVTQQNITQTTESVHDVFLSGGLMDFHEATDHIWHLSVTIPWVQHGCPYALVQQSPLRLPGPLFSHSAILMTSPMQPGGNDVCLVVQGGSTSQTKPSDDYSSVWVCPIASLQTSSHDEVTPAWIHPVATLEGAPIGTRTRHHLVPVTESVLAMIGGGLTCFSFGTYTSAPILLLLRGDSSQREIDALLERQMISAEVTHAAAAPAAPAPRPSVASAEYDAASFHQWLHVNTTKAPKVFHHVPLGPCVPTWDRSPHAMLGNRDDDDPEDHHAAIASLPKIAVHVSNHPQPHFDFVKKNFSFRHVTIQQMLNKCFPTPSAESSQGPSPTPTSPPQDGEYWYFRSVGKNMKTDRSNFWADFAPIARHVILPSGVEHPGWQVITDRLHQSCFRLNQAGMQLWTHYDTTDNVLLQLVGTKRVVMFPPSQYGNLYMKGSSSRVTNIFEPDLARFPRFADAWKHAVVAILKPGDALFIPANWFHHITALTSCVGVNLFYFRSTLHPSAFDAMDLYGNKDLPRCTTARESLRSEVVAHLSRLAVGADAVPRDYVTFTLRQLIQDLEEEADAMDHGAVRRPKDS